MKVARAIGWRSGRIHRAWITLLVVAIAAGCQSTRLRNEDLPPEPIALLHWADKAARKRAESFAKASELPAPPSDRDDSDAADARELRAHLDAEVNSVLAQVLEKDAGRLMLYWPRTGELERVEAAPLHARPLAWSADHKRLLFVSSHRGNKPQLYEYHLERRDLSALTFGPDEHARGDYDQKGQLAIQSERAAGRTAESSGIVYLASSGGRFQREIGHGIPAGTVRILPDASQIVYEQVRPRRRASGPTVFDSFIATWALAEGAQEKILVRGREPAVTPDGQWIVFASESSAGYRLRRMRPDGTSRVLISPGGAEERMPTVSPGGDFIAFVEERNGSRRLAIGRFDGQGDHLLMMDGWSEFPVW